MSPSIHIALHGHDSVVRGGLGGHEVDGFHQNFILAFNSKKWLEASGALGQAQKDSGSNPGKV